MTTSNEKGLQAEAIAARYLEHKGYQILARRYRSRYGEIDLIAQQCETLVFLEVKYRQSLQGDRPASAVNRGKQKRICQTALVYLRQSREIDKACRFDVVELWQESGRWKIHHYHNAFEGEGNGI